jgi:hypothetical protein
MLLSMILNRGGKICHIHKTLYLFLGDFISLQRSSPILSQTLNFKAIRRLAENVFIDIHSLSSSIANHIPTQGPRLLSHEPPLLYTRLPVPP